MSNGGQKDIEGPTQSRRSWWLLKWLRSKLSDESKLLCNQLRNDLALVEFMGEPTGLVAQRLAQAKNVLDGASVVRVDYPTLWGIEGLLLPLLPDRLIPDRIEKLRSEYERLATAESFANYLKEPKPDPKEPKQLQAHAIGLLGDVQRLRMGRSLLLNIRLWNSVFILAIGSLALCWFIIKDPIGNLSFSLQTLAIFSGLFGACLSILSRLYSIPIKGDLIERFRNDAQRIFAAMSPLLSMVEGGIAALVMLFLLQSSFAQSLFAQELLPAFHQFQTSTTRPTTQPTTEPSSRPAPATTLPDKLDQSIAGDVYWAPVAAPKDSMDVAKIIIWCFLAGFSERLIPDILSQLANKAAKKS